MSLVIAAADGTPLDANSYLDLITAKAFLNSMGADASALEESHLLVAMTFLNGVAYCGKQISAAQPLPFPREEAGEFNPVLSLTIAAQAQAWTAHYARTGAISVDNTRDITGSRTKLTESTVDVLTRKWAAGKDRSFDLPFYAEFPMLEQLINRLTCANRPPNIGGAARFLRA